MQKEDLLQRIRAAIEDRSTATLITIGEDGTPKARLMEDHSPYGEFDFWLATHKSTRKVAEIAANPRGALYYELPEGAGYVLLLGRVELKTDPESRRFLWRDEWKSYWPDGPDSEDYVPIHFIPERIEYYDGREQIFEKNGYAPVVIDLREN